MAHVHATAQKGFGAGTNDLYDRARPSYQPQALSFIRNAVKAAPPFNVVEIGAGTGIFTRALLSHSEWSDAVKQLQAFEPSEGMRTVFSNTVNDDRVKVAEGTFAHTTVESGWADLIIIAQAFHWCPDYNLASAEFSRILKPNGLVAFIWNLEDREAADWIAQLRDRIERHEGGTPQFRLGLWRQTFDTPNYKQYFEPPKEQIWEYQLEGNKSIVVDRACSKSYIAILPEDEREQVKQDVAAIIDRSDGRKWIDESKGLFEYPYKTYVVIAQKK
ncbi:S-adenosyl-L-methionine-dependent methyltransferase [Cyathus striatus]|nr:S-adenosyl-L-methionine-dependent methyltransferase [Cyathus striatus]